MLTILPAYCCFTCSPTNLGTLHRQEVCSISPVLLQEKRLGWVFTYVDSFVLQRGGFVRKLECVHPSAT